MICSLKIEFNSSGESKVELAEKTSEALHLKDEFAKHLQGMLRMKQVQCDSYERRIEELGKKLYSKDDGCEFSPKSMDEVSSVSNLDQKLNVFGANSEKIQELALDMINSSMQEQDHNELLSLRDELSLTENGSTVENMHQNAVLPCDTKADNGPDSKLVDETMQELQSKLKAAEEEIAVLRVDLEVNQKLLGESQVSFC